ncbi:CHAT domain-containing protein [Actinoplanes sp. CA-015351]|uniref:CHAT domain-containing protein n=1 Tax=Actinoplanes sp. CA-015351 TaxID=3239897 RepID=UPI003D967CCC
MTELSFTDAENAGGYLLLAEIYHNQPSTQLMLMRAGIPMNGLAPFGQPNIVDWWRQVGLTVEQGAFARVGQRQLFAAARQQYPGNKLLSRLAAGEPGHASVLMLLASPEDRGRMRLELEARAVESIAREYPDRLRPRVSLATRLRDLERELVDAQPLDILHFAGHGTADGRLIFDGPGSGHPVDPAGFSELVAAAGTPRCVVFSSCFSGNYLPALRGAAKNVIGSEVALSDKCAVVFSRAFYRILATGRPVPDAYRFAAAAMRAEGCGSPMRCWPEPA